MILLELLFADRCVVPKQNKQNYYTILFEIERESYWREIIQIIAPSSWLEIEQKISFHFKFFYIYCGTKETQYLDHTILFYVKNALKGRRLTSGKGLTLKPPSDPCVLSLLNSTH